MRTPLEYARVYLAALRFARNVKALPDPISPEEAFAFTQRRPRYGDDRISPIQKPEEIVRLLELLRSDPPATVLEIGTDRGGTLFLWTRFAAPDALLVTVDIRKVLGRLGRRGPFARIRSSFERASQRIEFVDECDSHHAATVERVRSALAGRQVDFLFIDGDHAYESVKRDHELYAPLVRPGGLIAFHDISPTPTKDTEGTARFWEELASSVEGATGILAEGDPGYGIGVYRASAA